MNINANPNLKTNFFTYLLSAVFVILQIAATAQIEVVMNDANDGQTFNGCSGVLFDSGGNGPGEYSQ